MPLGLHPIVFLIVIAALIYAAFEALKLPGLFGDFNRACRAEEARLTARLAEPLPPKTLFVSQDGTLIGMREPTDEIDPPAAIELLLFDSPVKDAIDFLQRTCPVYGLELVDNDTDNDDPLSRTVMLIRADGGYISFEDNDVQELMRHFEASTIKIAC